jgi:tetratricopeptide (TPR) repeat protein
VKPKGKNKQEKKTAGAKAPRNIDASFKATVASGTVGIPKTAPQSLTVEQALVQAARHQAAGRFVDAENLLRQILRKDPRQVQALQALGILAHTVGKTEVGADFLAQAIKINPNIALLHANRGEMCRLLGKIDEAIAHGKKAVALNPKLVSAHSNLGIALFDAKDFAAAEKCQQAALALKPDFTPALNNMGSLLREKKDFEGAEAYYRRAIAADPGHLESINNLGEILLRTERPQEGLKVLDDLLARKPAYPEALANRGYALSLLERETEALASFMRALQLRPEYPEVYTGIARVRREMHDLGPAEAAARRALELKPNEAETYSVLGSIFVAQGHADQGREAFERALALDPDMTSAKLGLGNIFVEEGKFPEAEEIFKGIIDDKAEHLAALFSLAQTKKVKPGDAIIANLEAEAEKLPELTETKATFIHFALGKIYDDLGEADKAFPHFIKGCALKRKKLPYDADAKDVFFRRTQEVFSKDFIDARRGHGFKSAVPIFVLGQPRSGTTLTEQIIASHPSVFGAGELSDMLELTVQQKAGAPQFPDNWQDATPQRLAMLGKNYVEGLQKRKPDAARITDKMPANFLNIGLIHLALPDAKIVHVQRNPLDTCISCFTRLFAHNQAQTYDLYELGRFYRAYKHLMDHWQKVLPPGSFYNIQYEALVDDTEGEARKLLDYCDLEWDDACLDFHKHERNIRTASVTQVRQPIYKTSLARWKKYEKFLGPLIEGLGDAWTGE